MTTPPDPKAVIALTVYLIGLALTFGVRTWQHHRRTGDSGIRRIASDSSKVGRLGVWLFAGALLLGATGPLLALVVPASTVSVPRWAWWLGLGLSLTGLALVLAAQQAMGNSWRIGVDPSERTGLVTTGAFTAVRNPIFSAMALAMAGVLVMTPNAISAAAMMALIAGMEIQVRAVEEPYLLDAHGQDFLGYTARVGRFVPFVGRIRSTTQQAADSGH